MSRWLQPITRVYRVLLAFYPAGFRAEFGQEMQEVLATALAEAQQPGGERPWRLFWREIRDWPGSVVQAHQRRRKREMTSKGFREEKPLPPIERLAAMILFLLPLALPLVGILTTAGIRLPEWMVYVAAILLWGALLLPLGWALIKGMPRWSLPYLGAALVLGIILLRYDRIWSLIYPLFTQRFGPRSAWSLPLRILYVAVFDFIMLFVIGLTALIVVHLLRLVPHTRGVWLRIRADWTQLSFLLYGGLVFIIALLFDEYRHDDGWQFLAWICLALGAWMYLRARSQKRRILALICGATGVMWIVALAKWMLIPLQKWPAGYPVSPSEVTRGLEAGSALVSWVWILMLLLAPALLTWLPQEPGPLVSSEGNPVPV